MRIVIIGGEAAGMSAAAKARRLARDAEIVVYEASEVISFGACGLPYFVGDDFQEPGYMAEFTPAQFAAKGIEVKTGHRVLALDAKHPTLRVEHNGDSFSDHYDRLMIATGAGAGSQNAIGTGVLGGTIGATLLGLFFVPLFYVVIKRIFPDKPKDAAVGPTAQEGR